MLASLNSRVGERRVNARGVGENGLGVLPCKLTEISVCIVGVFPESEKSQPTFIRSETACRIPRRDDNRVARVGDRFAVVGGDYVEGDK